MLLLPALQSLASLKLRPSQAPPPDTLHVALSLLSAVSTAALRAHQPDDQFVRETSFFTALSGVERNLSGLTWCGAYLGSTIKIFPAVAGCFAAIVSLLQLRCADVSISLLPPSHDASQQALHQIKQYKSLYVRCKQGLKGVSQGVLEASDDVSAAKADGKGAAGTLEDEALALAMCCAYYAAAAAAADRHATAAAAEFAAAQRAKKGGDAGKHDDDDGSGDDDDLSPGGSGDDDDLSPGDSDDKCDVSAAARM